MNNISMVICHFTMGGIIALWSVTGPRFFKGHEELEGFLYKLTGVDKNNPISTSKEEARVLWEKQLQWIRVCPLKPWISDVNLVKVMYIAFWVVEMILSCIYLPCYKLHMIPYNMLGGITVAFAIISMFLCMFSWWGCMEYGYFLSRVSRLKSLTVPYGKTVMEDGEIISNPSIRRPLFKKGMKYYFNCERPSQTFALTQLLSASTMTALAFLLVSGLYAVQYFAVVTITNLNSNSPMTLLDFIWMITDLVPGLLSLFPVVFFPKVYILRIHRIWKKRLIQDYEEKIHKGCNAAKYLTLINRVSSDKVDLHHFEVVVTIISLLLNVGIIIATLHA